MAPVVEMSMVAVPEVESPANQIGFGEKDAAACGRPNVASPYNLSLSS
jgi:hypothetical protein